MSTSPKGLPFITAALDDYGLSMTEFRVYCRVLRRHSPSDGCCEGTRPMAAGCQISDRTVRTALEVLTAAGLLSRTDRGPGVPARFDPQPPSAWADPSTLPQLRKQAFKYKSAVPVTAVGKAKSAVPSVETSTAPAESAVPVTEKCGTYEPKSAVPSTAKGTPMKVPLEGTPIPKTPGGVLGRAEQPPGGGGPGRGRSAGGKAAANGKPKDERVRHPAIQAYREVASHYPNKSLYDLVIRCLGEEPDLKHLRNCRETWLARGYNPTAAVWATEWYGGGIPPRGGPPGRPTPLGASGMPLVSQTTIDSLPAYRAFLSKGESDVAH